MQVTLQFPTTGKNHSNFQQNNTEQSRSQTKHLNRHSQFIIYKIRSSSRHEEKKKLKNKRCFILESRQRPKSWSIKSIGCLPLAGDRTVSRHRLRRHLEVAVAAIQEALSSLRQSLEHQTCAWRGTAAASSAAIQRRSAIFHVETVDRKGRRFLSIPPFLPFFSRESWRGFNKEILLIGI